MFTGTESLSHLYLSIEPTSTKDMEIRQDGLWGNGAMVVIKSPGGSVKYQTCLMF